MVAEAVTTAPGLRVAVAPGAQLFATQRSTHLAAATASDDADAAEASGEENELQGFPARARRPSAHPKSLFMLSQLLIFELILQPSQ